MHLEKAMKALASAKNFEHFFLKHQDQSLSISKTMNKSLVSPAKKLDEKKIIKQ